MLRRFREINNVRKLSPGRLAELVPDDLVVLDPASPAVDEACRAAVGGDHGPVAALLAATRDDQDWTARTRAVRQVARLAATVPDWAAEWASRSPRDPDLAVIRAASAILRGWDADGPPVGTALMNEATPLLQQAMDAAREDPEPWSLAMEQGRALGEPDDEMDALLQQVLRRDPAHVGGLVGAVLSRSPRWGGNRDAMFGFADHVAASSPDTSRLRTLPLTAFTEYLFDPTDTDRDRWRTYGADAIAQARAWLAIPAAAEDPAGAAETRNMIAWAQVHDKRFPEAHREFVAIGDHASVYPWSYLGEPLEQFLLLRESAAVLSARTG